MSKLKGRISRKETVGPRYAIISVIPDQAVQVVQKPGQYTKITFFPDQDPLSNVYSIASAPRADGSFDLCVQLTDERLKAWLDTVEVGKTAVEYTKPAGNFFVPPEDERVVLIAGGSGITPLKAILEDRSKKKAKTVLLYGCNDDAAIPFYEELKALRSAFSEVHFFAEKTGTGKAIAGRPQQKLGGYIDSLSHYLMCGPPPFMEAIRKELSAAGVDAEHIHQDRY